MFGFLKKKLKGAIEKFSKNVEEEAEKVEEIIEEEKKLERIEETPTKEKVSKTKEDKDEIESPDKAEFDQEPETSIEEDIAELKKEVKHEPKKQRKQDLEIIEKFEEDLKEKVEEEREIEKLPKADIPDEPEEKTGFFGKLRKSLSHITIDEDKFDELFWDLELAMLENNVAVEVIEKIKKDLSEQIIDKKIHKKSIEDHILSTLKKSIDELFDVKPIDIFEYAKKNKPLVIAMIGINGSGKTTTLAKLIYLFQKKNLKCVVAAGDTFRAAAIQQLEEHTKKLGVRLIKHDYGSDAAAVAYDAIEHAKAKGVDVVLIDTGGRLHSNANLMEELHKILRISKPHLKIFVGESITGNDCVEQVKLFNEKVGIDGIVLSKADVDEKGGTAISVSYVTGKPVMFIGTGQEYGDLEEFDKEKIVKSIGL